MGCEDQDQEIDIVISMNDYKIVLGMDFYRKAKDIPPKFIRSYLIIRLLIPKVCS